MLEIVLADGRVTTVELAHFTAMEGWEIQRRFLEFAASTDTMARAQFTMDILGFAKIIKDGGEIPLRTAAVINNHLGHWKNVEAVFEGVLLHNGIDPKTHAQRDEYWEQVGAKIAVAFTAEMTKLLGPAFAAAVQDRQE